MSTATKARQRGWLRVESALPQAHGIAWDGCHKIYVLLDETQMDLMVEYGYGDSDDPGSALMRVDGTSTEYRAAALAALRRWYDESCGLRLIQSVRTTADPNDGFTNLIPQLCAEDEED